MEISKNRQDDKLVIGLTGRLDTTTAPLLEKTVKENLDGIKNLVFDFAQLDYISSAGLRILLAAQKTMNKQGSMIVKSANDSIMEVFEITGFIDMLTVEN